MIGSGLPPRANRPAKRPGTIEPCIPTLVSKPPEGPQWIYEIKHDGYRLLARIVSKHREHPYRSGPSKAWLKTKNPAAPGMLRLREEP
jgi:ATP-dependent DNA ligase